MRQRVTCLPAQIRPLSVFFGSKIRPVSAHRPHRVLWFWTQKCAKKRFVPRRGQSTRRGQIIQAQKGQGWDIFGAEIVWSSVTVIIMDLEAHPPDLDRTDLNFEKRESAGLLVNICHTADVCSQPFGMLQLAWCVVVKWGSVAVVVGCFWTRGRNCLWWWASSPLVWVNLHFTWTPSGPSGEQRRSCPAIRNNLSLNNCDRKHEK